MPETSCWCRLTRLAAWADIAMQARASGVRATSWRERFLDWITLDLPMGWTRGRHRAGRSLSAFQREHRPPPRPVPPSCCCPDTRRAPDVQGRGATGRDGVCHRFFRSFLAHEPPSHRNRRSEEHTSELQVLIHLSYAVFCLKKKNNHLTTQLISIN